MKHQHLFLLYLLFLLTGCDPRGLSLTPAPVNSTITITKNNLSPTAKEKSAEEAEALPDTKKLLLDKNVSSPLEQKAKKKQKKNLEDFVKEIPKTIKKIPVINEIPKVIPAAKEIPIVNKIADYLSKRPGKRYKRLGKYAASIKHENADKPKPKKDETISKLFDYSQHFSGGLHYDETVILKKVEISTGKDGHTYLKLILPKITPYTVDYDPKHKQIVVMLSESIAERNNQKLYPPNNGLIQTSRIETSQRGTLLLFQLTQDGKINVLESYAPTYIMIDITPMYPLFMGTPAQQ